MASDREPQHIDPREAETTTRQALVHGRTLFSMLMFSIFAVMVYIATGYTWPANFLPFVIGLPGMALTLLQIVLDVRAYHDAGGAVDPRTDFEKYMDEISKHTTRELDLDIAKEELQVVVEDRSGEAKSRQRREVVLFGYFFFLLLMVLLFGFWIGFPIFLFAFLRFYARESWGLSAMLTAGGWTAMYLILAVVLEQILFEGFLTVWAVDTWLSAD